MQIIYNRIKHDLIQIMPTSQAAYQQGRGTVEQIQSIQQIIEKANEFQQPCIICFIDYTKAFDSIDQQKLLNALLDFTWINRCYINLIARLYENSSTRVRTSIGTTNLIKLLKGVKQGDIASAILFCICVMVILSKVYENHEYGFKVGGEIYPDISYADDIALITKE